MSKNKKLLKIIKTLKDENNVLKSQPDKKNFVMMPLKMQELEPILCNITYEINEKGEQKILHITDIKTEQKIYSNNICNSQT